MLADCATHPTDPKSIDEGDLMAFTYYGKVKETNNGGNNLTVQFIDSDAGCFNVTGDALVKSAYSADQFKTTEKVSMTRAAEILAHAFDRPFSVCFIKQDKSERVLRGRLIGAEPYLGRSTVEDLDQKMGDRTRLVDHRSLKWLIVSGVKYVVK